MLTAVTAVTQTPANEDERWGAAICGFPLLGEISSEERPEPLEPGVLYRIDRAGHRPRSLPRIAIMDSAGLTNCIPGFRPDTRGSLGGSRPRLESECSQTPQARKYRKKRTSSRARRIALFDQQRNCFECNCGLSLVHDSGRPNARACMVTRGGQTVLICKGCHRVELEREKENRPAAQPRQ